MDFDFESNAATKGKGTRERKRKEKKDFAGRGASGILLSDCKIWQCSTSGDSIYTDCPVIRSLDVTHADVGSLEH
jgi:hypothetical protein